ncbi:hypothetical protein LshimejAT787_0311540 [Lyophyllum shimeji]|uniref:Uncharacterized protein n=1 Tax=Lyophyllum shimeji TaxID=47721 RepID=A0A9P3UKZ3_LYOSH|nr:hypothetical protein LshimejAT787_0311540 [Lyophyllum shimeji]
MTLALRKHSLPEAVTEKKRPVSIISTQPEVKRRWRWRLRRDSKSSRSPSPFASRTTTLSAPDPEKPRTASSPLWDATFEPTPPLSTIFPSMPNEDLQLTPINSRDSAISEEFLYREKPSRQQSRRQSINKLARTLGVFANDFNNPLDSGTGRSPYITDSTTQDVIMEVPRTRRMKLSLTTKLNTLPSALRPPFRSRASLSISTPDADDVHSWGGGETHDGSRGSGYSSSYSPISPITFKPPTPVATVPSRRASALNLLPSSTDKLKPDDGTPPSSSSSPPQQQQHLDAPLSPSLNRSRSLSFAPPRLGFLKPASSITRSRPQTPTPPPAAVVEEPREEPLPVKAHWLESPTPEEEAKAQKFVETHPEYADEYRTWTGQWNQDDMQQVIRMLRNLK